MSDLSRISRRLPGRTRTASRSVISGRCSTDTSSGLSSSQFHQEPTAEAAQRVSDLIDEALKKEALSRQADSRKEVKVMLLGQAESGKSTLQKQFQLYHASHTLEVERPSWRIVVYANLIKAVRTILEELDYEFSLSLDEYPWAASASEDSGPTDVAAQNEILALRRNLLPLMSLEGSLSAELSEGVAFVGQRRGKLFPPRRGTACTRASTRPVTDLAKAVVATNRAAQVLGTSFRVIEALWRHRSVEHMLRTRKLRLDESGLFFLNHVHRIAQMDYIPSIDDVLHVRLQTVGVIEHSLKVNTVAGSYMWKIYDVGGTRSQRPAWCSYFDDVNALIFLAPISAFDQYLEEDPLTNRIHDSLQLLTTICANKLLKNAQLVLLLNKTDVLRKKLEAGVQIRQYITSYGNRPNNFATAAEYFRSHFLAAYQKKDAFQRKLHVHFTAMLDVEATQIIIAAVGDLIMRKHIAQTGLL
ncbi:guanine nucleotide binding protein, alpha subunit [Mycena filopes]|nr:guanine nucleotide binding protein, alpha subunit [Mycena filopes]